MRSDTRSKRAGETRHALAALVFAVAACAARNAYAEPPSCAAGDRDCGRQAFAQGTSLFDQQEYEQARRWFLSARSAAPHPIISFNLALCYARLGKPSLVRAELQPLLAGEALEDNLRVRAAQELAAAEASLAHLRVESAEPGSNVIELDGRQVDAPTGELVVDPGLHRLRISSRGLVIFAQELTLAPGEHLQLRVTNRSRAIDVVVVPAPVSAPARGAAPQTDLPKRGGLSPAWFYVSGSATLLLGGAALWSGLDVNSAHDDYRRDLPRLSQAEADERVVDGHARERRTNWLLGVTAIAATGTALIGIALVDWQPKRSAGAASLRLKAAGAELIAVF
jgi:hypothetical protein